MTHPNKPSRTPEIDFAADYEPGKRPYLEAIEMYANSHNLEDFVYNMVGLYELTAKKPETEESRVVHASASAAIETINDAWYTLKLSKVEGAKGIASSRETLLRVFRAPVLATRVQSDLQEGVTKLDSEIKLVDGRPAPSKENLSTASFTHKVLPQKLALTLAELGLSTGHEELPPINKPLRLSEIDADILRSSIQMGKGSPMLAEYLKESVRELNDQIRLTGDRLTINTVAKTVNSQHTLESRESSFKKLLDQMEVVAGNLLAISKLDSLDRDQRELIIRQNLQNAKFDELAKTIVELLEESREYLARRVVEFGRDRKANDALLDNFDVVNVAKELKFVKGRRDSMELVLQGAFDMLIRR